jgi:hypothetical protein
MGLTGVNLKECSMFLSDVVRVLGESPLRDFPWGVMVANTINLFTEEEHRLTEESTGEDVHSALNSLTDEVRELVLRARLDVHSGKITAPAGGNMVIEYEDGEDKTLTEPDFSKVMSSPVFIAVMTTVTLIIFAAMYMFSNLAANRDIDWTSMVTGILSIFGVELPD